MCIQLYTRTWIYVPAIDGLSRDTEHKYVLVMLGPGGGLNI